MGIMLFQGLRAPRLSPRVVCLGKNFIIKIFSTSALLLIYNALFDRNGGIILDETASGLEN